MAKNKAAITVSAMIAATVLSKLLGATRQIIFASRLGDSVYAVAFSAASKIPLSVFDMLFSAAILGCFIPFYNGEHLRGDKNARGFSSSFFTLTLLVTVAVSAAGVIFSKQIIFVCAPSLTEEAAALASKLLSVMFPMIVFTGAAYVLTGILQSHGSFILPSLMSSVSNAGIIVYLLAAGNISSRSGIITLAAVYVLSWAVQFLTLAVPLVLKHLFPLPRLCFSGSGLSDALKMSPAIIVGAWLLPVSSLLTTFFSSFVSDSAVAAFDYSLTVWLIAAGVLTYGVCNFIFPSLSRLSAQNSVEEFVKTARDGVKTALLLSLPVTAGMIILSDNIICILYMRGSFGAELASSCGNILKILSFSIPAFCVTEVLSRVFYAEKKSRLPMVSSLCGIAAFALSGALGTLVFEKGTAAIAVSYVIGQYICALVLFSGALSGLKDFLPKSSAVTAVITVFSLTLSAFVMMLLRGITDVSAVNLSLFENFIISAIVFSSGVVVYLICIFIMRKIIRGKNTRKEG